MMSGILSPEFLQAAGRAGKAVEKIVLVSDNDDPMIFALSCTGDITITSTKNGETINVSYSNLEDAQVSVQADNNTPITIKGKVTGMSYTDGGDAGLQSVDLSSAKSLAALDVSAEMGIREIIATGAPELETLQAVGCTGIKKIDLRSNTSLTMITCSGCSAVNEIYYPATNEDVSSELSDLIKANDDLAGTVYSIITAPYYGILEGACDEANWTISAIPV